MSRCPVCKSPRRKELYSGLTDRVFYCAPGRWNLYQCEDCRSAYLDPRPSPDAIHLAYQSYYTHEMRKQQATEELSPLRRVVRVMANGYRNRRFGGDLQPSNRLGGLLIPMLPRYRQALDRELRYLPPLRPGARLLDVGFGSGEFMALAQRVGWRVAGADPDPVAVANAREMGMDARQGGIESFSNATRQFDVITLGHVIEHVHDPVKTVETAYALLKSGGSLYIETPNIDAYGRRLFKEYWRGLEVPRHLVLFNWSSMVYLLKKAGFQNIKKLDVAKSYPRMAGASRAIRRCEDPYLKGSPRLVDKINAEYINIISFFDREKAEYITLYAHKVESRQ